MNGAMNMIRRFLAGLFMALFASSAFSGVYYVTTLTGTQRFASASEACQAADAAYPPASGSVLYTSYTTYTSNPNQGSCNGVMYGVNGDVVFGGAPQSYAMWSSAEGCFVGESKVLTFGVGWSATGEDDPNEGTWGNPPMSWCDGSCMFSFEDLLAVYMDDEVSANGYYEISATSEYLGTGATCTTPSEPPENPDPEPPCGDGNCTPGDGDGDGPGDGDGGGDPGDGDGDGDDGDTPGGENPGDGAGGDGDGPGNGTGSGGAGQDGDGEGEDEGGGECGIPGKPPCAVKIDETGVPDGNSIFNGVNTQVDNLPNHASIKDAIDGIKNSDLTPSWTWTFQLPTGCTPFQLGGYNISIDVCQWQGMIHDIMSMIWAAATVWFLIALFMRAGD